MNIHIGSEKVRKFLRHVRHYYPFSIAGTLVILACLYLIGSAFATSNPYAFLLGAMTIIVLVLLAIMGRIQANKAERARIEWDASAPVYAREKNTHHKLVVRGLKLLPFYRLHFRLSGTFSVGRKASLKLLREISTFGETIVQIPQQYPLSGIFHAHANYLIRDMFGLTGAELKKKDEQAIVVRPAMITDKDTPRVEAQSGQENKSRMKSSDIERYFMREYIPGDRHRDINWKASSRFSELITRISPVTQEKTQLINIQFRPYSPFRTDSLRAVAFLDHCKSMLLFFIRSVKKEHPEYEFRIVIGNDIIELENENDIDQFATDICGIHYRNPRGEIITSDSELGGADAFVFTTSFDQTIAELSATTTGMYIFRTCFPEHNGKNDQKKQFSLLSNSMQTLIGGKWLIQPDIGIRNPSIPMGQGIRLEDESLEVRIV